ncbi:MAG: hypothetical protein IJK92_03160 [Bacteroidales bacterium]|nr:hypothetical protein [Bacteroidales bacterium]
MRRNRTNVSILYSLFKAGHLYEYGYTDGGRAFVTKDGLNLKKDEAMKQLNIPKIHNSMTMKDCVGILVSKYNM